MRRCERGRRLARCGNRGRAGRVGLGGRDLSALGPRTRTLENQIVPLPRAIVLGGRPAIRRDAKCHAPAHTGLVPGVACAGKKRVGESRPRVDDVTAESRACDQSALLQHLQVIRNVSRRPAEAAGQGRGVTSLADLLEYHRARRTDQLPHGLAGAVFRPEEQTQRHGMDRSALLAPPRRRERGARGMPTVSGEAHHLRQSGCPPSAS
jgi:hypothetical protein